MSETIPGDDEPTAIAADGDQVDDAAGPAVTGPAAGDSGAAGQEAPTTAAGTPRAGKVRASGSTASKAKAPASSKATDSGRMTPKGGVAARQPTASGRYTPPIPRQVRHSPPWYPFVLLGFLVVGLLMIVLNYVNVLPGGTSNWYLIGGIGAIVVGLFMATFYH